MSDKINYLLIVFCLTSLVITQEVQPSDIGVHGCSSDEQCFAGNGGPNSTCLLYPNYHEFGWCLCRKGSYYDKYADSKCIQCPPSHTTYGDSTHTTCICDPDLRLPSETPYNPFGPTGVHAECGAPCTLHQQVVNHYIPFARLQRCEDCSEGTIGIAGTNGCNYCDVKEGYYQSSGPSGAIQCSLCAQNSHPLIDGSKCVCDADRPPQDIDGSGCPYGLPFIARCRRNDKCQVGEPNSLCLQVTSDGQMSCICNKGYYYDRYAPTKCTICPPGLTTRLTYNFTTCSCDPNLRLPNITPFYRFGPSGEHQQCGTPCTLRQYIINTGDGLTACADCEVGKIGIAGTNGCNECDVERNYYESGRQTITSLIFFRQCSLCGTFSRPNSEGNGCDCQVEGITGGVDGSGCRSPSTL